MVHQHTSCTKLCLYSAVHWCYVYYLLLHTINCLIDMHVPIHLSHFHIDVNVYYQVKDVTHYDQTDAISLCPLIIYTQ